MTTGELEKDKTSGALMDVKIMKIFKSKQSTSEIIFKGEVHKTSKNQAIILA